MEYYKIKKNWKYIKIYNSIFGKEIFFLPKISGLKLRIYISGAITSDIVMNRDWQTKFIAYENFLKCLFPNAIFVNPGKLTPGSHLEPIDEHIHPSAINDWQYRTVMKRDLTSLMDCDYIAFIPDWKKSRGAKCEREVAKCLRLKEVYLPKIPILKCL